MDSTPASGRSLEEETATPSSILAWEISWTEEPSRCLWVLKRVRHNWATKQQQQFNLRWKVFVEFGMWGGESQKKKKRKKILQKFREINGIPKNESFAQSVVLYSKYSCYSRSGPCLDIICHSCQMCVVFWGCGQISTGTWLRPTDVFLPPEANNQGINLLCHLALNIGTTED